jgi:hypothetical protein
MNSYPKPDFSLRTGTDRDRAGLTTGLRAIPAGLRLAGRQPRLSGDTSVAWSLAPQNVLENVLARRSVGYPVRAPNAKAILRKLAKNGNEAGR